MQIKDIYNKYISFINLKHDDEVKYCPQKNIDNKLLHPRVVLKFNKSKASCPYCGLEYRLKSSE